MKIRTTRGAHCAIVTLSLALVGCGWSLRAHEPDYPVSPDSSPLFYRLDLAASSVVYRGNNGPSHAEALEVKEAVGNLFRARGRTVGQDRRPAPPARFRAFVDVDRSVWPLSWTAVCIVTQIYGCPTGQASATVWIELQVGREMYRGKGSSSALGGLYYNAYDGTPAAIARALKAAIEGLTLAGTIFQPPVPPEIPSPPNPRLPPAGDAPKPSALHLEGGGSS
jgi:hypothetical protein